MSNYTDVMLMFNNSAEERKYGVALDISYMFFQKTFAARMVMSMLMAMSRC